MSRSLICAGIVTFLSPIALATDFSVAGLACFTTVQLGDCTSSTKTLLGDIDGGNDAKIACATYFQPVIGAAASMEYHNFLLRGSVEVGSSDVKSLASAGAGGADVYLQVSPQIKMNGDILYRYDNIAGGLRLARTQDEMIVKTTTLNVKRDESNLWYGPSIAIFSQYSAFEVAINAAYTFCDVEKSKDDTTGNNALRAIDKETSSRMLSIAISANYNLSTNS